MTDEELFREKIKGLINKSKQEYSEAIDYDVDRFIEVFKQANYVRLADDQKTKINEIIRLWLPGESYGYNEATESIWKLLKAQGRL